MAATASTSSSIPKLYHLEKLTGPNYLPWSLRVRMLLEKAGNWGVVSGSEPNPTTLPVAVGAQPPTQDVIDAWLKKDLEARTELVLHMGDRQVQLVRQLNTSKEMWDSLQQPYQQTNVVSRVLLHRKLNEVHHKNYNNTEAFLDAWQQANDSLMISGLLLPREIQVTILLAALPDSWQSFISTQSTNAALTINELFALIRQEDQLRGRSVFPTNATPQVLLAGGFRFNQRGRFRSMEPHNRRNNRLFQNSPPHGDFGRYASRNRDFVGPSQASRFGNNSIGTGGTSASVPTCNFCRRRGHLEHECRTKRRVQGISRRSRFSANVAEVHNDPMDEDMSLSQLFTATACSSTMGLSTWYLDIGATHNMTGTFEWLHDYTPLSHAMEVRLGDDGLYTAEGHGTIKIQLPSGDITVISRVHYIPGLVKNLLSVNELTSNGTSIKFFYKYCIIKAVVQHGRHTRVICPQEGRLYPLGVTCIEPQMQSNSTTLEDQNTSTLRWHFRLGHPHVQAMKTLRRFNMAEGFTSQISGIELCEACIYGKLSRTKFPKSKSKTTRLLELIHSDVCGPMQTASLTGNLYYLTFIDDFSKYTHIYFLKHKSEVFTHFQHFVAFVERQTEMQVKTLRSDNGGEYISNQFKAYCFQKGIQHQLTIPYTPQQNSVAERKNRTLNNAARSLLLVAGLSLGYWEEAVATACYLQNRLPSRTLPNVTPFERWFGSKPDLSHLRIFGTPCYSLIPDEKCQKFSPRAEQSVLVGYGERFGIKGYRLYNATTRQFVFSRDVVFDEGSLLQHGGQNSFADLPPLVVDTSSSSAEVTTAHPTVSWWGLDEGTPLAIPPPNPPPQPPADLPHNATPIRAASTVQTPSDLQLSPSDAFNLLESVDHTEGVVPLAEALSSKEAPLWKAAMNSEIASLKANNTWVLTPLPPDRRAIRCRWILRRKYNLDGTVAHYKARLVARGFSQEYGIDYTETFSPTLRLSTFRALLAVGTHLDLEMHQMDVETAFLNGFIDNSIFMQQPPYFVDSQFPESVCHLQR
ncbi:hypothetical protein L7F22_034705 [Adiantum nelumboides]|nr:hypothetical protein [Adiantum nelumboides]